MAVAQLTDSGALLGSVLMVAAIPRLIFMLVGGAVVDRFSRRPVLRVFSLAVTLIVGLLTLLLWREALNIGLVYVIAALIGVCDAFFYPAAMSSVPKMIDKAQLPAANSLVQTGDQITQIAGPALAGVLIGLVGLPLAFAINTALFAGGAILLWLLHARSLSTATTAHSGNMLGSIREGLRYAWRDQAIRTSLIIIGMLNFALVGPLTVGTAAMTETYFGGAGAYGLLMAAMGVGSLAGTLGAGASHAIRHPGRILAGLALLLGVCAVLLGVVHVLPVVAIIMAVMGAGIGFTSVIATAWLQSRAVATMQGRLMSVLMFSVVVFDPFSQGLAGLMLDVSLTALFVGAGALLIVTGLATLGNKVIRAETGTIDRRRRLQRPAIEPQPDLRPLRSTGRDARSAGLWRRGRCLSHQINSGQGLLVREPAWIEQLLKRTAHHDAHGQGSQRRDRLFLGLDAARDQQLAGGFVEQGAVVVQRLPQAGAHLREAHAQHPVLQEQANLVVIRLLEADLLRHRYHEISAWPTHDRALIRSDQPADQLVEQGQPQRLDAAVVEEHQPAAQAGGLRHVAACQAIQTFLHRHLVRRVQDLPSSLFFGSSLTWHFYLLATPLYAVFQY